MCFCSLGVRLQSPQPIPRERWPGAPGRRGAARARAWGRAGVAQNPGGPQLLAQGLQCTRDTCSRDACTRRACSRDACSRDACTRDSCTRDAYMSDACWRDTCWRDTCAVAQLPGAGPAAAPGPAAWAGSVGWRCLHVPRSSRLAAGTQRQPRCTQSLPFGGPGAPRVPRATVPMAAQGRVRHPASRSAALGARCGFTALPGTNGFKLP